MRIVLLLGLLFLQVAPVSAMCLRTQPDFSGSLALAAGHDQLRTLHVAVDGKDLLVRGFRGASPDAATNVKSASKTLIAAVVGAAIQRGVLDGVDQPVTPLLADVLPPEPHPALTGLTVGHLLSMQAGLARTSGRYYGAWVASDNWVRAALARPLEESPGGTMRYSTGNTHLLSAILQRETGEVSYVLANRWLAAAGITVSNWMTDPQGIALGGNQVAMRPRALLALGELYRRDGLTADGDRLLPEGWVRESWTVRAHSRWTGDGYGYAWFIRDFAGFAGYYGWGYGGQMLYVVPDLSLTVVMTSNPDNPSGRTGYRDQLHTLMTRIVRSVADAGGRC